MSAGFPEGAFCSKGHQKTKLFCHKCKRDQARKHYKSNQETEKTRKRLAGSCTKTFTVRACHAKQINTLCPKIHRPLFEVYQQLIAIEKRNSKR
jgi:hypothetical protein